MRVKTKSLEKRMVLLITITSMILGGFIQSGSLSHDAIDVRETFNETPATSDWERLVTHNITYVNQTLVNNTVYQFNGTELHENGGYFGTYTFDDAQNWKKNWSTSGPIQWMHSLGTPDDHKSLLNLPGNATTSMQTNFSFSTVGPVEFWLRYDGTTGFFSAALTNTQLLIDYQVSLHLINGKFYTVEGPRSMHGSQGAPVYTYLQDAVPGTWYLIKLFFIADRFRIGINDTTGGQEYGDFCFYEPSLWGVDSLILKTGASASSNANFYIDSIWYAWDPLYSTDAITQKYTTFILNHGITSLRSFDLLDIKLSIQFYALQVSIDDDSLLSLMNSFDQSKTGFRFNKSDPAFVNGTGNFAFQIMDVKGNLTFFNASKYFRVLVQNNNSLVEFKTYISLLEASFSYSSFNITSEITYCHAVNLFMNYTTDSADIEPIQLIIPNVTINDGSITWQPTRWRFKQARIPMPQTNEITSIDYSQVWTLQSARASTLLDSGGIDTGVAQVYLNGFMDNNTHELVINKNDTNNIDKNSVLFVKLDKRDLNLNVRIVKNVSGIMIPTVDVNITEQYNLEKYKFNIEIMTLFDWDLISAIPGNKQLRIDVLIGGYWYPTYFPLESNTSVSLQDINEVIRNITVYNLPNFIFTSGTNIFRGSIYYSSNDSRHNSIFKQSSEITSISSVFRFQSKIRTIINETVNPYIHLSSAATGTVDCYMRPSTSLRFEVLDIYNRTLEISDFNLLVTEESGAWNRFDYISDLAFKNMTVQSGAVFRHNASIFIPIASSNGGMNLVNEILNDTIQASDSRLLVTPRIIDANATHTRQAIDLTFEMDLRQLFGNNISLDQIAVLSGAFWGTFVADASFPSLTPKPAYTGILQVRNARDNGWATLSNDLNLTSWIDFNTANFNSPSLSQFKTNITLSCSELKQYADENLRLFFKLSGHFEGKYVVDSSLSQLFGSSHESEMFCAILDHFGFDATMFRNNASASGFNKTYVVEFNEQLGTCIYEFGPTIPTGAGAIERSRLRFDVSSNNPLVLGNPAIELIYVHKNNTAEQMKLGNLTFNVNRVPTITRDLDIQYVLPYGYEQPANNYSSLPLNLSVSVHDCLNGSSLIAAFGAKVLFFFQGSGDPVPVLVGESYTDSNGVAWITKDMAGKDLKFNRSGNVLITARVVPNYGNSSRQLVDLKKVYKEPLFTGDYYGMSQLTVLVNVLKSPTTLTIQIQNVPTDATPLYASSEVYIRPVLIDTSILEGGRNAGKPGFWIFNLPVTVSVNGSSRVVNSSIPAPFPLVNGGTYHISAAFAGTYVYLLVNTNSTSMSRQITCKRFEFIDPSYPVELHVGEPFQISVTCFDHFTGTTITGLPVDITYFWSNTTVPTTTDANGIAIFSGTIPLNAGGQNFTFHITHHDPTGTYEQATYGGYIEVMLYDLTIQPALNVTGSSIPIRETLGIRVNVTNANTGAPVIGNIVHITIFNASWIPLSFTENFPTGDVLAFKPLVAGTYYISFVTRPGQEYRFTTLTINFTATVRPTVVSMAITNNSLVPNSNFSITLYLNDALSGELLVGNQIQINRTVIGAIPEEFIGYRTCSANESEATFNWMPLRAGTFVFRFTFFGSAEYNASMLVESLVVDKRVVSLSMQLNDTTPRANDELEFTIAARDLSTLNNDAIKNLTVQFVVFDENSNYTIQTNKTSLADGTVRFKWQPTQSLAGKTVEVLAVSAETDAYRHAWISFNLTISMIQTVCTLTANDTSQHYIGENVTFTYSVLDEFNQFLFPATLNLSIVNIGTGEVLIPVTPLLYNQTFTTFNHIFNAQGTYLVTISYGGIDGQVSGSSCSLSIYIEKRPVDFNLSGVPVLLHGDEPVLGSISITDGISGMPLGFYPITVYYLDPALNVQVLGANSTDASGCLEIAWDIWAFFENVSITNVTLYFEAMETAVHGVTFTSSTIPVSKYAVYFGISTNTSRPWAYAMETVNFTMVLTRFVEFTRVENATVRVSIIDPDALLISNFTINTSINASFSILFTKLGEYNISFQFAGDGAHFAAVSTVLVVVFLRPVALVPISLPGVTQVEIRQPLVFSLRLNDNLTISGMPGRNVSYYYVDLDTNETVTMGILITDTAGITSLSWTASDGLARARLAIYASFNGDTTHFPLVVRLLQVNVTRISVSIAFTSTPVIIIPGMSNTFTINIHETRSGLPLANHQFSIDEVLPNGTQFNLPGGMTGADGQGTISWLAPVSMFYLDFATYSASFTGDAVFSSASTVAVTIANEKMLTRLTLHANKSANVQVGETILVEYSLISQLGDFIDGRALHVSITNLAGTTTFDVTSSVVVGSFIYTPSIKGNHEITIRFDGESRYKPSSNTTSISCGTIGWNITLTIVESYYINYTVGCMGHQRHFLVPDYYKNLTLRAEVFSPDLNTTLPGLAVNFYYITTFGTLHPIGINTTDEAGIVYMRWNYPKPTDLLGFLKSIALQATINASGSFTASTSNPIYLTIRKIFTYIPDQVTDKIKVNHNGTLDFHLKDEFNLDVPNQPLTVNLYKKTGNHQYALIQTWCVVTGVNASVSFTPDQVGFYKIITRYVGSSLFRGSSNEELIEATSLDPAFIKIVVNEDVPLYKGFNYNVSVSLVDENGTCILGQRVSIKIRYYAVYVEMGIVVITGENSTFPFYFENKGGYVIEACYAGNAEYTPDTTDVSVKVSEMEFSLVDWFLFLIFCCPAMVLTDVKATRKKDKKSRTVVKMLAVALAFMVFMMDFSMVEQKGAQLPRTGYIDHVTFARPDPVSSEKVQQQAYSGVMNQDIASSQQIVSNAMGITNDLVNSYVPDEQTTANSSGDYDRITIDGRVISPEVDTTPPEITILNPGRNMVVIGNFSINASVHDLHSNISQVIYHIMPASPGPSDHGIGGQLALDPSQGSGIYTTTVDSTYLTDGDYYLTVNATDNRWNTGTNKVLFKIQNVPSFQVGDTPPAIDPNYMTIEISETLNLSLSLNVSVTAYFTFKDSNGNVMFTYMKHLGVENFTVVLKIDEAIFSIGRYSIQISVLHGMNVEQRFIVVDIEKKSTQISIEIENPFNPDEPMDIYTGDHVNVIANLSKMMETKEPGNIGIRNQPVTFSIYKDGEYQMLGTRFTNRDGIARLEGFQFTQPAHGLYKYFIKVDFQGSYIYKSSEGHGLAYHLGREVFFQVKSQVNGIWMPASNMTTLTRGFGDSLNLDLLLSEDNIAAIPVANQRIDIYVNESVANATEQYIGSGITDENGIINFTQRLRLQSGIYDLKLQFNQNASFAPKVVLLPSKLHVERETTNLLIETGGYSNITALYNDTIVITATLKDDEYNPIEGGVVDFAIVVNGTTVIPIGTARTKGSGQAYVYYKVSLIPGQGTYQVRASYNGTAENAAAAPDHVPLFIERLLSNITIQGGQVEYGKPIVIKAKVYDPFGNPVAGEMVSCSIVGMALSISNNTSASGEAWFVFDYTTYNNTLGAGTYSIQVSYVLQSPKYRYLKDYVKVLAYGFNITRTTMQIVLSVPEQSYMDNFVPISFFIINSNGQLVHEQFDFSYVIHDGDGDFVTQYTNGKTDFTGRFSGNLGSFFPDTYTIDIIVPGTADFEGATASISFKTQFVRTSLLVQSFNTNRLHRNEQLLVTVMTEHTSASRTTLPIFVNVYDAVGALNYSTSTVMTLGSFTCAFTIPNNYQAGQYNITFTIDPSSGYQGSTSFLFDVVERTRLSIDLIIINPNATNRIEGQLFIYEPFNIQYTLVDEDNHPLSTWIVDVVGINNTIGNLLNISIFNNETFQAIGFFNSSGVWIQRYIPNATGVEFITGSYFGDRFFDVSFASMTISINKRPIELVFTNVSHNNAARQQFSTYANRNDFLTVTGCIFDNLTGRGIIGANISLKYDSRFLLGNTSISFGLFQFTLNISSFDGLKQAGAYVISLYYNGNLSNQENERFYSSKLNIFEFLTWNYMFFDSSIKADNCELKYEISIKDQDNQTIYELPFHLEIENSKTKVSFINSIYYSGVMNPRTIEVGSFNLKAELDREKYISKFNLRLSSTLSAEGYTIFNCPLYIFKNEDNEYLWSLHGLDLFKLSYYSSNQSNNLTLLSITNQKDASYSQGSSPNVFRDMLRNMYAVQTEWRYNVGVWTKIIIFALQAIAEAQYDFRITFSRVLNAIISVIVNFLYGALDNIISKKEHSTKEAWLIRIFAAALKWFFHYLKATIFVVIENLNDPFLLSNSYWSDIGIQLDDPNMDPRGSTSLFNNQLEMDDVIENYWGGTGTPVERGTGYLPDDFAERFPDMVNTDVKGNIKTKIMDWLKKALNKIIEIVLEFLFIWMASVFLALERDKSIDTIWRMAANAIYHFITGAFYGISSFWKLLTGFVGEDVLGEVMNYIVMFLLVMFLVEVMIDVLLWIIAGIATGGINGDWSWDNWERWSNTWDPWIRIFIDILIFIIKWSLIIVIMIYWIGNTSWLSVIVSGMKNVVKELFKQLILEAVMSIFFSFIFSFLAPYIQQAIENLFSNLVI